MGKPLVQRLYLGIITGVFMVGSYFLLTLLFDPNNALSVPIPFGLEDNELILTIFKLAIGVVAAQFYFFFLHRGTKKIIKSQISPS